MGRNFVMRLYKTLIIALMLAIYNCHDAMAQSKLKIDDVAQPCHCEGNCPSNLQTSVDLSKFATGNTSAILENITWYSPEADSTTFYVKPFGGGQIVIDGFEIKISNEKSMLPGSSEVLTGKRISSILDSYRKDPEKALGQIPNNIYIKDPRALIDGILLPPDLDGSLFDPDGPFGSAGCPTCVPSPTVPQGVEIIAAKTPKERNLCLGYLSASTSEESLSCTASVSELCNSLDECSLGEIAKKLESNYSAVQYRNLVNNYDSACLNKQVTHAEIDSDFVMSRSGVVRVNPDLVEPDTVCSDFLRSSTASDHIFCSGVITSANHITTAQHCFYDKYNRTERSTKSCLDDGAVEFRTISAPSKPIEINSMLDEKERMKRLKTSEDYVFLATKDVLVDGAGRKLLPTPYHLPEKYSPMLIASYHPLVQPASTHKPISGWWDRKIRASDETCAPLRVSQKCMITKCQTIGGFSGAPFWSVKPDNETGINQTVWTGIQVQGGLNQISSCKFDPKEKAYKVQNGNLAIRPDETAVSNLQKGHTE